MKNIKKTCKNEDSRRAKKEEKKKCITLNLQFTLI